MLVMHIGLQMKVWYRNFAQYLLSRNSRHRFTTRAVWERSVAPLRSESEPGGHAALRMWMSLDVGRRRIHAAGFTLASPIATDFTFSFFRVRYVSARLVAIVRSPGKYSPSNPCIVLNNTQIGVAGSKFSLGLVEYFNGHGNADDFVRLPARWQVH